MSSVSFGIHSQASGSRSSASDMAERSNNWAQGKLLEKKSALDKQLHQAVVKMHVDKLDMIADLARMKKSASTSSLEKLGKDGHSADASSRKERHLLVKSSTDRQSRSLRNSPMLNRKSHPVHSLSPMVARRGGSASSSSASVDGKRFGGIEIRVTKDYSSSEDEDHHSHLWNPSPSSGRNKQRVSARYDNTYRSQDALVQNVKRRFAKQVNTGQLINEDRLNVGKHNT